MYTVKDIKCTIIEKRELYRDWRDWFIIEKKPFKNAHKTMIELYLEDIKIHELLIPINMEKLKVEIEFTSDKPTTITTLKYLIREMCMLKELTFDNHVSVGDTVNLSLGIEFFN